MRAHKHAVDDGFTPDQEDCMKVNIKDSGFKEMKLHSIHLLDLKLTHNAFRSVTLNVNITFR